MSYVFCSGVLLFVTLFKNPCGWARFLSNGDALSQGCLVLSASFNRKEHLGILGIACVLLKCGMGEGQVVAGNGIEHLGNLGILEIACVSAFEQNTHYFQDSEISEMLITLSGWPRWWWVGGRDVVKLSRHHPAGNSLTPCFHVQKSVCFLWWQPSSSGQ